MTVRHALLLCAAVPLLATALPAAAATPDVGPAPITVNQIIRGANGTTHQLATEPVPNVGMVCTVTITATNNQSVHPNTDIVVSSGTSTVTAPDVEHDADGIIHAAGSLTLGETVTVAVRLGADGVFSGGMTAMFACVTPPPVTTTTTTAPPVTTTTMVPPAPPTTTMMPPAPPTTVPGLPVTGPSAFTLILAVIGTAFVLSGLVSLVAAVAFFNDYRRERNASR